MERFETVNEDENTRISRIMKEIGLNEKVCVIIKVILNKGARYA